MDKDTKFALLVVGVPLLGAAYCALMLGVMFAFADARQHPIITATVFVLAPSLVRVVVVGLLFGLALTSIKVSV